jgi:two-component system LytT family response regulator
MIRVILVDDERLARKRLTELLSCHPGIEIVGEASDVDSAARLVREKLPHIVFLDIHIPPHDGFQLIPLLPLGTRVVFVTAHDSKALQAFDAGALDYLVKPVSPARLATAISRLAQSHRAPCEEILLGSYGDWVKVPLNQIAAIQANADYTTVHVAHSAARLVQRTMKEWRDILPLEFLSLSRSLILNRASLSGMKVKDRNNTELALKDCPNKIMVGRVALLALRRHLKTG